MTAVVSLGIATTFTAIALALAALAFSLDYWTVTVVRRDELRATLGANNKSLEEDPNTFSRNRGLFRECYSPFHQAKFLDTDPAVIEGKCRAVNYEIPEKDGHLTWGQDYWTLIHLRRAHFALFVVAMLMLVVGSFCGAIGCWKLRSSILKGSSVIVFLAAFCVAAAMAFFHGVDYLEKNVVKEVKVQPPFYAGLDQTLKGFTDLPTYSYSYGLGWSSMVVALIAAVTYLCASHQIDSAREKSEKRAMQEQEKIYERNRAYEMMDNNPYDEYSGYGAYPYQAYAKGGPYPGYEGYEGYVVDPRY